MVESVKLQAIKLAGRVIPCLEETAVEDSAIQALRSHGHSFAESFIDLGSHNAGQWKWKDIHFRNNSWLSAVFDSGGWIGVGSAGKYKNRVKLAKVSLALHASQDLPPAERQARMAWIYGTGGTGSDNAWTNAITAEALGVFEELSKVWKCLMNAGARCDMPAGVNVSSGMVEILPVVLSEQNAPWEMSATSSGAAAIENKSASDSDQLEVDCKERFHELSEEDDVPVSLSDDPTANVSSSSPVGQDWSNEAEYLRDSLFEDSCEEVWADTTFRQALLSENKDNNLRDSVKHEGGRAFLAVGELTLDKHQIRLQALVCNNRFEMAPFLFSAENRSMGIVLAEIKCCDAKDEYEEDAQDSTFWTQAVIHTSKVIEDLNRFLKSVGVAYKLIPLLAKLVEHLDRDLGENCEERYNLLGGKGREICRKLQNIVCERCNQILGQGTVRTFSAEPHHPYITCYQYLEIVDEDDQASLSLP